MKVLLLVWLLGLPAGSYAGAKNDPRDKLPGLPLGDGAFATSSRSAEYYHHIEGEGPYTQDAYGFEAEHRRTDLYTLARLAVDELEFLAGIRVLWNRTEKQFDRWALQLKLKGDISLGGGRPADASAALAMHPLPLKRKPARPTLSLQSILLPDKIRWKFGFDPTDQVLFGELKWGPFVAIQSDLGSRQEVKMVFQYTF